MYDYSFAFVFFFLFDIYYLGTESFAWYRPYINNAYLVLSDHSWTPPLLLPY